MSQKPRAWIATPAETRTAWVIATACVAVVVAALLWPLKESSREKPRPESHRLETKLEAKQSSGSIEKLIEKVQREEPHKVRISPAPEVQPKPAPATRPAPEPAKVVATAPKKAPQKAAPATTVATLASGYYVQLGAFKERNRAVALQKKLASSLTTHLKKKANGMTALWAGPYNSSGEATKAKAEIAKKTGIKGFTVKN